MLKIVEWLRQHRQWNIVLLISYFFLVVLPHEQVGLLTVEIFGHLTRDTYNFIILIISLVGLLAYGIPTLLRIWRGGDKGLKIFYLLSTIFFITLTYKYLFVINIEFVHFVQYSGMALLLFPLTMRYSATLFWATLLGVIDEAYQYFYLSPHRTDYYDFNDVITNLLGAALMLVLLRTYDIGKAAPIWYKSPPFFMSLFLGVATLLLYMSGILHFYPPVEGVEAPLLLVRVVPTGFWSHVPPHVTYHVTQPLEGTLITIALLLFYRGLDRSTGF